MQHFLRKMAFGLFALFVGLGIAKQASAQCGGTPLAFTTPAGSFDDGSGPGNPYSNSQNCFYMIKPTTTGGGLTIHFDYFKTEPGFDSVYIYNDTVYAVANLIAAYSGGTTVGLQVPNIVAPSGRALIRFRSDASVTYDGWKLSYFSCVASTPVTITPGGATTFYNGSVSLTASGPFTSFSWNTGDTTASISASNTGTYTVLAVDSVTGCFSTASIAVQDTNVVCVGAQLQLNTTFPTGNVLLSDNFNNGTIDTAVWTSQGGLLTVGQPCTPNGSNYVNFDGPFNTVRYLESKDFSLANGAVVTFDLNLPTTFNAPCEQPDPGNEEYLEYSVDGGTTWNQLKMFLNSFGQPFFGSWGTFSATIPNPTNAALARVRLVQPTPDGTGLDNWNVDNFTVSDTNVAAGTTIVWSPATGLSSNTIANPVATVSNNISYSVTVSYANGITLADTLSLFVYQPTIALNGDSVICNGDSVLLTASNGASYLWNTGDTTKSIWVKQAGSYSVTVNNSVLNCTATSIGQSIQVNTPTTPVITANGPTSFCNGGSVTLTSSVPTNIVWSNGDTTASITVGLSGNYTITYIDPVAGCTATSLPISVTNATPNVVLMANNDTLCTGGTLTLKALTNSVLQENFNGAAVNSSVIALVENGSIQAPCVAHTGNAMYFDSYTSQVQRGVTTPAINTLSGGNISFDLFIGTSGIAPCEDADAGEEVHLQYSINGGTTWTDINVFSTANTAPYNGVWGTYSTSIPSAAQNANTAFRIVQPNNSGNTFDNWNLDNLNITAGGSSSGLTYAFSGPGGFNVPAGTADSVAVPVPASGNYQVVVTYSAGTLVCTSTATATVLVNAPFTPPVVSGPGVVNNAISICSGSSVVLTSSAATGNLWSTGATTQSITVTQSGTYSTTLGAGTGCSVTSDTISVTVLPSPQTPVITGPNTVCAGQTVTLSTTVSGNLLWNTGATTASITVPVGTYNVTSSIGNCSATSQSFVVTALPVPSVPTITRTGDVLSIAAVPGATYQWYLNGNALAGATTTTHQAVATGTYTVTVTVAGCSSTSAAFAVATLGIADAFAGNFAMTAQPNPFGETSTIRFELPVSASVSLDVFDATGRKVSNVLTATQLAAGTHTATVSNLAPGVYFLRLSANGHTATLRLVNAQR